MEIIKSYLTKNPCYNSNRTITVKGLMLHSVGCNCSKAKNFLTSWNREDFKSACVHGFIDANDGNCYQTLPWNHRGWHAGGSANNTHIGVEMCEHEKIKYIGGSTFTFDRADLPILQKACMTTYLSAVELYARLCDAYDLDPLKDGVIISHKEGHARGVASGHGDPEHWWTQLGMSYTMNRFRNDVYSQMTGMKPAPTTELYRVRKLWSDSGSQIGAFTVFENAKKLCDENPGFYIYNHSGEKVYPVDTVKPFLVQIRTPVQIHTAPELSSSVASSPAAAGVYTIVEVQNGSGTKSGWGLLKAYATNRNGWINLDEARKI